MVSNHLPECQRWFTNMPEPDECPACEMFRACEQRVENRIIHGGLDAARFNAGLDAAREAVKALCHQHPLIWPTDEGAMQALDATLDALRNK